MIAQIISSILMTLFQGISLLGLMFDIARYGIYIGLLAFFMIFVLKKFFSMTQELEKLKNQQYTKQDVQVYRKLFSQERNIIYLLIFFFTATYTFFNYFSMLPWLENNILLPIIFSFVMVNMKKHIESYPFNIRYIPFCQIGVFFILYHFIAASFKTVFYLKDIMVSENNK
ncbi:hypothetical protein ABPG74_016360 [Tetrahymena malaccensis]